MTLMDKMIQKVYALIEDFPTQDFEVFTYTNSNVWTLQESNISAITKILHNGNPIVSGQGFSLDPNTNKITITGISFQMGDILEVDYTFTKYSRLSLLEYIRAALVWLSIYDYSTDTYFLRPDEVIVPDLGDPQNKTGDLIAIIASILIKPNYIHYRMPNLAVNYPNKTTQEDKIKELITAFKGGVGYSSIITWNRSPGL